MLLELQKWWRGKDAGERVELDDGVGNMLIETGFAKAVQPEEEKPRRRLSRERSANMELRE